MATKKTTTTITTRQVYEKVCAMEKMLKEFLEVLPPAGPDRKNQPYLAAAGPDLPLSVIRLENVLDYLPCFEENDMLYALPGNPLMMSYCPVQMIHLPGRDYITGTVIFFRIDNEGAITSLKLEDICRIAEFLAQHDTALVADGTSFTGIRLD